MYKILPLLVISLFFVSCTSKNNALRYFKKTDMQASAIQNTKKTDILKNEQPELIFWATYINNINKEKELEKETFLVSIYYVNSETQNFNENNYNLSLNNQKLQSIKEIEKDNKDYQNIMLKNNWGNYYLVEFDKVSEEKTNLKLRIFNQTTSSAQLVFEK